MLHRIGRISIATKSASAILPITFNTFRAAIMTAGSFVLITLIRGTIFSCMVNLSRAVEEDVFFLSVSYPSKTSSLSRSFEPPQRVTKACRPLTLIARLLVLLKIAATTGNSSFLMVLKSRTGKTVGRLRSAASTRVGVGDSKHTKIMGRMSTQC